MPGGDGTGPLGSGPGTGWGRGSCRGGGGFGRGGRHGWQGGRGADNPARSGDTTETARLAADVEQLGRKLTDMESKLKGQDKTDDATK